MLDKAQLREAIATFSENWFKASNTDGVREIILEAARLVVEGREVWWCEEHEALRRIQIDYPPEPGAGDQCQIRESFDYMEWTVAMGEPCRMVRMILIDGEKT